jgi:hypothetical protein
MGFESTEFAPGGGGGSSSTQDDRGTNNPSEPQGKSPDEVGTFRVELQEGPNFSEEVRVFWKKNCRHPNLDLGWACKLSSVNPQIQRLIAFVVKDSQGIQGLLVGRIEKGKWPLRLGYLRLGFPHFKQLVIPYPGLIGAKRPEVEEALAKGIRDFFKTIRCDLILFSPQPENSTLVRKLKAEFPALFQFHEESQPIWRGLLFEDFPILLKSRSRNHRRNLKRYGKLIEQELGDNLQIETLEDEKGWDSFFGSVESVAKLTYQRGLGAGFQRDQIQDAMYRHFFQNGNLRAFLLKNGEQPVAFWVGLFYGRGFYTWATGFDPKLGDLRPGHYLLKEVLETLSGEMDSPDWIDFGFGDAQYKRGWVDERSLERRSLFLWSGWKGILIGFPFLLLNRIESFMKSYAKKSKLGPVIKRWWRKLLTRG